MAPIEISYSKAKTFRLLALCGLCGIGGLMLTIFLPNYEVLLWHFIPLRLDVTGIVIFLFFGWLIYYLGRRMLGGQPGLIIDKQGLWRGKGETPLERIL